MTTTAAIRKQLVALLAIVKPANSLASRIDSLTNEQRGCYREWQARHERWCAQVKVGCENDTDEEREAALYAHVIEGDRSPQLRRDVRIALFGPEQLIPITTTDEQAMRIYIEYMESRQ